MNKESDTIKYNMINTSFNFHTDSNGGDPDLKSPTLKKYHKILWSKPLPCGNIFELSNKYPYLHHKSEVGEFYLGSDSISHSYKNQVSKRWIYEKIPNEVNELFEIGSTIGGYIIFPNKKINNKFTINQSRGINHLIDDRFDLTLECIRLFYVNEKSPLYDTIYRYKNFFDLFDNFMGYVDFFLLNDLVDSNGNLKFYLPFDNFKSRPEFKNIEDYLVYKDKVIEFINHRNIRISKQPHNFLNYQFP